MPDNKIRAVIFDMDGTLLNTLPDIARSINSALTQHGFPSQPDESYRQIVGSGMRTSVMRAIQAGGSTNPGGESPQVVSDPPSEPVTDQLIDRMVLEVNAAYAAAPAARTTFYDGVRELLNSIAERELPMSILSNKPDVLVQQIVRELLGDWDFRRILGQKDGHPTKPDPATALETAAAMKVGPADVLFLGDSDIDMITSLRAGMFATGAAWGFRDAAELWAAGAMAVVNHPSEVVSLVNGE
jgi:phosphoglycolate phosphatase